jgi:predicted component of type VI protein secretion system
MPCSGCQQRREIGRQLVAASRAGDKAGVKLHLGAMSASIRKDIAAVLKQREAPKARLRLTEAAQTVFHRK